MVFGLFHGAAGARTGAIVVYLEHDGLPKAQPRTETLKLKGRPASRFYVLPAGSRLEIVNDDSKVHTVVSGSAALNFRRDIAAGGREAFTLQHTGKVRIRDLKEPNDHVQIRVVPNDYFVVTGGLGGFAIRNVPPGTYALRAVTEKPGWRTVTREVTVKPGETTQTHVGLDRVR